MIRIFRRMTLLALLIALVAIPTLAQDDDDNTIGAPGIGDPYFPTQGNGGYDVQHYDIDLVVDIDAQTIAAVTTIEAVTTQDLTRFNLDFSRYEIESITVNDEAVSFSLFGNELAIANETLIPEGEAFTVVVTYQGTPPGQRGWNFYPAGVIVAGEPVSASGWFPVNEHPLDKATYAYEITVAEPFIVGANGILQETIANDDGTNTFVWTSDDPMASYLTTVAIGDFKVLTDESPSGVPVRHYIYSGARQQILDVFAQTPEMIEVLEAAFGPYPFEVYGVVVHDLSIGFALETQTLNVFGNSFVNESVAIHELAHEWFGNSVSLERWQDIWLNEAFASYAQALWWEHKDGEQGLLNEVGSFYANMARVAIGPEFPKAQVVEFLETVGSPDILLTPEQMVDVLVILTDDSISREDIAAQVAAIAGVGGEIATDQLGIVVDGLLVTSLQVSTQETADFLVAIGREDLLDNSQVPVVADPTPNALFSGIVYQRGALTLHALRLRMGDDAFFNLLQTYTATYRHSNAGADDFIALAEELAGEDLSDLWDAWLYQTDLPDIPENGLFIEDFGG